jgi:hypothetical protein
MPVGVDPHMKSSLIINTLVFATAISCIIAAGFLLFAMIGEINRQVPADQRISYFGGRWEKYSKIYAEYKRVCPGGLLLLSYRILLVLGFGLLLMFAWLIGIFG